MKAQVLHKYDPEMKEKVWVTGEEMPDPKIEKASDVIVKIGAAGVCRTDLHIIEGVWKNQLNIFLKELRLDSVMNYVNLTVMCLLVN